MKFKKAEITTTEGLTSLVTVTTFVPTSTELGFLDFSLYRKIVEFQLEELRTFIDIIDVTSESVGPWLRKV